MNKYLLLSAVAMLAYYNCNAQASQDSLGQEPQAIYSVNPWISGGIALTGVLTNSFSHRRLRDKPGMSDEHVAAITSQQVNSFDQWALQQDP